jgi:hypothetical protein
VAIQPIPIYNAPFQGGVAGTNLTTTATGIVTAVTSVNCTFVNDGYTVLYIIMGATPAFLYIPSVPDNAGRVGNIGVVDGAGVPTVAGVTLAATTTYSFGPFRPVWWNFGGTMNVVFSNATTIKLAALRYSF